MSTSSGEIESTSSGEIESTSSGEIQDAGSGEGAGSGEIRSARSSAGSGSGESRVVRIVPGGPLLVQGPVRIELEDGGVVETDRFMVAICTCRRSRNYPLCDTSHRRCRVRSVKPPA